MQVDMKKKAGVVILIPDKIDFKTKFIARDKEGHYIILESSPIRGYNSYKHICTNRGAPKDIRKTLEDFKNDTDRNTAIVRDFNNLLSTIDRSFKQQQQQQQKLNN